MRWLALLLFVPLVAAGTTDDPEVSDPKGDHFQGVAQDPFNSWDIRYALWTEDGCDGLRLVVGFENVLPMSAGLAGVQFGVDAQFAVDGVAMAAEWRSPLNPDDPGNVSASVQTGSSSTGVSGSFSNATGEEWIDWCFPVDVLGLSLYDDVSGLWVEAFSDNLDGGDRQSLDIAPDNAPTETGATYTFGGPRPITRSVAMIVDSARPEAGVASFRGIASISEGSETLTFTPVPNDDWTLDTPTANVEGTGGFTFTATYDGDATNGTPAATLKVDYEWESGLRGQLELEVLEDVVFDDPGTDNPPTGNETPDDKPDKKSPGLAPVLLVGAMMALALRRRP